MKKLAMAAGAMCIAIMFAFAPGAFAGSGMPNPPAGGLAPRPGHGAGVRGEHHAAMHKAVEQLGRIKQMLSEDTDAASAGHRTQAILLIDQAIEQLNEGIAQSKH